MQATTFLLKHLPVATQDFLRTQADVLVPARRRAVRAVRAAAIVDRGLATRVSPDGYVLAGIFVGLRLPTDGSWGGMSARLAGTYEKELAGLLAIVIAAQPTLVIDVGAAEGYYALGLAQALPKTLVYAFDIDRRARLLCAAGAKANSLRNVRFRGRLNPATLQKLLSPGAFLLSDCEGYERELLDPIQVPALKQTIMLVELHEFLSPGLTDEVLNRFRGTHNCLIFDAQPRDERDGEHLTHLTTIERRDAVQEGRPMNPYPMQWAFLQPKIV